AVSPDGRTVIFTTTGTEGGRPVQSIWSVGLDGDRLTRVVQASRGGDEEDGPPRFGGFGGLSGLQFAKDGRTLYYRQANGIYAVAISRGQGGPFGGGGSDGAVPSPGGRAPAESPLAAAPGSGRGGAGAVPRRVNFTARVEVNNRAERRQVFHESWRVMKHR